MIEPINPAFGVGGRQNNQQPENQEPVPSNQKTRKRKENCYEKQIAFY